MSWRKTASVTCLLLIVRLLIYRGRGDLRVVCSELRH